MMKTALLMILSLAPMLSLAQQNNPIRIPMPSNHFDSVTKYPAVLNFARPFSAGELPFFCRQEYRFQQRTQVPLRIRLGSLEQCNYLEGKSPLKPSR